MTEYQRIENELTRLGWTPQQRNGDHVMFYKPGNPEKIVVTRSVTDRGRALRNSYADIRKVEPLFSLGRQQHMLPSDEEREQEDSIPDDIPEWMLPGKPVRWTAPEKRDWSKLKEKDSVMNRKYTVSGFRETEDGTMAILTDPNTEGDSEPFTVHVDEIDSWLAPACKGCGKNFPASQLTLAKDMNYYCSDCAKVIKTGLKDSRKPEPERKSPVEKMAETDPDLKEALDILTKLQQGKVQPDEKTLAETYARFNAVYGKLSLKAKKTLGESVITKAFGSLAETDSEKMKEITPLEAWMRSKELIYEQAVFDMERLGEIYDFEKNEKKPEFDQIKKNVSKCTYVITKLPDRKYKRRTAANIISVTTPDERTAMAVYRSSGDIISHFHKVLPKYPTFVLLICQKAGIRQYLASLNVQDYDQELSILENNLAESEKRFLGRARLNRQLPPAPIAYEDLKKECERHGMKNSEEAQYAMSLFPDFLRPKGEPFDEAKPIYRFRILHKGGQTGTGPTDLRDEWSKDLPADYPLQVDYISKDQPCWTCNNLALTATNDKSENGTGEDSDGDDGTLLTVSKQDGGKIRIEGCGDSKVWVDHMTETFRVIATEDLPASEAFWKALSSLWEQRGDDPKVRSLFEAKAGITESIKTKANDNKMETKNILENTNPGSTDKAAGELTTRQLLLELKARGVQFKDLTITVKKTIDYEEL